MAELRRAAMGFLAHHCKLLHPPRQVFSPLAAGFLARHREFSPAAVKYFFRRGGFFALRRFGIKSRFVPFNDLGEIEKHFTDRTRVLFLETPTNPTLRCVDLQALAAKARQRGIITIVDNTFATPILQKPLTLGAPLLAAADSCGA